MLCFEKRKAVAAEFADVNKVRVLEVLEWMGVGG